MVNFQLNLASIVGIVLAVGGAALYGVRSVKPELSRDYDIFFAAVSLLCGGILFFYGWRFDPIMQFGQVLLAGSTVFFAFENFRLRGTTVAQAKRSSPIVDQERRVSKVYEVEAELDQLDEVYEQPVRRRIRGTQDPRSYREEYETEVRRRPNNRRSNVEKQAPPPETRRRRPSPENSPIAQRPDQWETGDEEETKPPRRSSSSSTRTVTRNSEAAVRPRNSRPPEDTVVRRPKAEKVKPTDYVDFQPVDESNEEEDNSKNFDY